MNEQATIEHQWGKPRMLTPYAVACAWAAADPRVRVKRSVRAASDYKRISMLPETWGRRLDALGVSYRELRWLAGTTGHAYATQREARYKALVGLLETAGANRARQFAELERTMPRVRRGTSNGA